MKVLKGEKHLAITLGTDLNSARTVRHLSTVESSIAKIFERLSSGLRINSASDDAAGLAVSYALDASRRVGVAALRNINDGISALSIMDGSLEQQSLILVRLKELAEQSANGVFGDSQRLALDTEYQELVKEYNRLAASTQFNGVSLLRAGRAGNLNNLVLQTGLNGSTSSTLGLSLTDSGKLSGTVHLGNPDRANAALEGVPDGNIDSSDFFYSLSFYVESHSLDELSDFYHGQFHNLTVTTPSGAQREMLVGLYSFGSDLYFTGWEKRADGLYHQTGQALTSFDLATGALATSSLQFSVTVEGADDSNSEVTTASIDVSALRVYSSQSTGVGSDTNVLDFSGVRSVSMALAALQTTTARLEILSQQRGNIGAFQARLGTALATMSTYTDVTAEASSRIKDADMAAESAALLNQRIREQTSALVLKSSVNQRKIALDLLRV